MQAILGFAWLLGRGKAPDEGQRDDQGTQHEGAEHDMSDQHQQDGEGREAGHQEFDRIIDSAVAQLVQEFFHDRLRSVTDSIWL